MIPCLAIPFLNRKDLLQRCVSSIDFEVGRLLILNNGKESLHDLNVPDCVMHWDEKVNGQNMGVAGSWNQALEYAFKKHRYEYVIIMGNDVAWAPGDLQKFHEAYDPEAHFMSGNWAFSSFALTRKGFGVLGWFDENYYPGYLEDADMWRRCCLTPDFKCVSVDTNAIHGDGHHTGSMTINSDPALKRIVQAGHEKNWRYHIEKWGGIIRGGTETYQTPFNKPGPLWAWKLSEERLKQPHFKTEG